MNGNYPKIGANLYRSDTFKEILANLHLWRALRDPEARNEFGSLIADRAELKKKIGNVLQDHEGDIPDASFLWQKAKSAARAATEQSRGVMNRRKTYTT
jgi:hypothetical protein